MNLTPRQLEVARIIRNFRAKQNISPTFQEVADAMGVNKTTIHEHVDYLVGKGVLRRAGRGSRSLELCFDPDAPQADERAKLLEDAETLIRRAWIGAKTAQLDGALEAWLERWDRVCGVKETVGVG